MAFTYRNPLEIAINKLPSKQSDQLLALTTDEIEKTLGITNDLFSFSIKPEDQELLQSKGVTLAPIGFKSHSHPMCKMVENHILYVVLPNLVKSLRNVAFFSLRGEKHSKFIKMYSAFAFGKIKSMGMYNAIIDAKDKLRYGHTSYEGFRDRVQGLKADCLRANHFPKVLLLHDELHFLSPLDIAYIFEQIPEIDRVLATTVAPIEAILGDSVSKEPRVYTFKVVGDVMSFYPDGVASEAYEQNLSTTSWPFKYSSIKWANRSIRVHKLYSLFAHHVFSFDRGRQRNQMLHFDKPSCLLSSELKVLTKRFDTAVINRSTLSSLSTYMACLKSANAASAVAKLRQLEKRDLYPDELNFVYSFGEHFKNFGMRDDFDISILQWVKDKFCQVMPDFISKTFFESDCFHINMRSLLTDLATKGIEIETEELVLDKINWIEFSFFSRMFKLADDLGINLETINKRFNWDTKSEPFFTRNGRMIFPNDGENGQNFAFESVEVCRFEGLIKPRRYNLRRDFLKKLDGNWRRQLFLELPKVEIEKVNDEEKGVQDGTFQKSGFEKSEPNKKFNEFISNGEKSQSSESNELVSTEDRAGFEGSIPVDLIDMFNQSGETIKIKKRKRKNDCVFVAIAGFLGIETEALMERVINSDISDELFDKIDLDKGLSHEEIEEILVIEGLTMVCTENFENMYVLNRKYGPNGKMYCTISSNHCMLSSKDKFVRLLESGGKALCNSENLNADSHFDFGTFLYSAEDALKLAKSLNRGTTGVISEINPTLCKDLVLAAERATSFSGRIGIRFGFAGSGKTKAVTDWINYTPGVKRMFVSPRRLLADQVKEKVKGTHCEVHTFETALSKIDPTYKEVFIDEVGLLPPGYLALLQISAMRRMCKAFNEKKAKEQMKELLSKPLDFKVLGDPLQMRYHSAEDTNLLGKFHEIDLLCKIKHKYLLQGYRFGSWFREMLDIPTRVDDSKFSRKFFADTSSIKREDYDAILVASQDEKRVFAGSLPVYTFSESQGLDKSKRVLICLSQHTFSGNANSAIVALTRSKVGFDFILRGMSLKEVERYSRKTIWQFPIEGKRIPMERIVNMNPGASFYETPLDVGNSSIQDKAANDLFILPFINLAEEEIKPEEWKGEVVETPEWFKTHIPVFDTDPMLAEIFDKVCLKEKREFQSILGMSNQFLDMEKNGSKIEILPFARQNVFPHHQSSDDVTFWEGVKKRIRKSNWRREASKFEEYREQGAELLKEFLSMLPDRFEVTIEDIENGEKSFLEKRKIKSEKMWANHKERSDIDWKLDHVFLFMKSQYCTKEGKMYTTAKAGQTLACFQHIVLYKFGPMLRAIESAFIRACGESYYIHSGKNFFCLDSFVKRNMHVFDGQSIESDYQAFDSSQDHVILAFEMKLLEWIQVSKEFQLDYLRLKLTLGCRLGSLAIMRFTGEFCTFLFNTFANMLFTKLKYKIDYRKDRILFAGDDMCSLGSLKRRRSERAAKLLSSFSLQAIEEVRKFPMFCGWYLSPYGILKSPKLLWARIKMMSERQLLKECVDNYLFEAIFAYRLGERLYEILKEEDFEYHYLVIRFFVRNSKLLTGLSKSLILEIGEGIGNKWLSSMSIISSRKLNQQISRLMPSHHPIFTKMPVFSIRKFSIASRDLSQTSKSPPEAVMDWCFQTLNFWTIQKLIQLEKNHHSTNICTMASYLLESKLCYQILEEWKEESSYMTGLALTLKGGTYALIYLSLNLIVVILDSDQSTASPLLTQTWQRDSDLEWILTVHSTNKTQSCLLWTLVLHTDVSTQQDFWRLNQVTQGGHLKQFQDARHLGLMKKLKWLFWMDDSHCIWKKADQTSMWKRGSLELIKCVDLAPFLQSAAQIQKKRKDLGPFQQGLIDLPKMSLEDVLQQARRHRVGVYLWKTYIDPNKEILKEPPPDAFPGEKGFENKDLYYLVCNHYCKYLFGNIAVFGSSDKTQFPAVDFDTPSVHYSITVAPREGETKEQKEAREGSSGEKTKSWKISLSNVVPELKTYCATSKHNSLNECTFRKICEPFADLSREFLHERWKWPKALERAPWVAFDFATGLKMNRLTPDEKQVIDKMTRRLFRTEGQKGVFEAGTETNLELEG
uniref:Polyprotein n=1 Tax=Breadfruit capillovirus 1 TaxID=2794428 RepID=A0A7T5QZ81_9VIRU|nr:polyprotein [Breadfruit capillovirus 1]